MPVDWALFELTVGDRWVGTGFAQIGSKCCLFSVIFCPALWPPAELTDGPLRRLVLFTNHAPLEVETGIVTRRAKGPMGVLDWGRQLDAALAAVVAQLDFDFAACWQAGSFSV